MSQPLSPAEYYRMMYGKTKDPNYLELLNRVDKGTTPAAQDTKDEPFGSDKVKSYLIP